MFDYQPMSDKPNPMSRKQWEAMPAFDKANFLKLGGTLYDQSEPQTPRELETMAFRSGKTITRGQWDAMTERQKVEFVKG